MNASELVLDYDADISLDAAEWAFSCCFQRSLEFEPTAVNKAHTVVELLCLSWRQTADGYVG